MSEKLCTLRTKGGGGAQQTETVLWTNSSPSSNFGWQEVTLSSDIDDFDYIKFDYRANIELSTKISLVVSVTELKTTSNTSNSYAIGLDAYRQSSGNLYIMDRSLYLVNDTTIHFNPCRTVNATQTNDAWCIPLSIIGIKNMGGIRTNEKYDILPFQNINASAIPVFSTKGTAKAIWITYAFTSSQYRALQITNVNPYTGEINNSVLYKIDTNAVGSYSQQANNAFVVTNGSVTLTNSLSSSALRMNLAYTY